MSEHYYTSKPQTARDPHQIDVHLRGQHLTFWTDRGVFAKRDVDFGTKLLLEQVQAGSADKILDVGCGYGVIGLTLAAESRDREVTLVDVNERAIELCAKNASFNQIMNAEMFQSDLFQNVKKRDYDMIMTNPPVRAGKKVVHTLFEQSYDYLRNGGTLWVVIQKKQGAPSAFQKLKTYFADVTEVKKRKGYRIFKATKNV